MSDEAIKARLKAAREELGTLEFEGLRAIQSAQRCIARGVPVYGVEVTAMEALIAGMRAALEELHGGWSERANQRRERLWLSPHCEGARQLSLLGSTP